MTTPPVVTVVRLNPHHPHAATETGDTHRMHARVLAATGATPPPGGRILWALPRSDILVIQAGRPALNLPGGYATATSTKPARLTWQQGQKVRFTLIGNPVLRPRTQPAREGRRVALPLERRNEWLHRHLGGALTITHVTGQDLGHHHGTRDGVRITHLWHAFAGEATVADPHALARLQLGGVGPAKGYGCGLLLVQEAP